LLAENRELEGRRLALRELRQKTVAGRMGLIRKEKTACRQ